MDVVNVEVSSQVGDMSSQFQAQQQPRQVSSMYGNEFNNNQQHSISAQTSIPSFWQPNNGGSTPSAVPGSIHPGDVPSTSTASFNSGNTTSQNFSANFLENDNGMNSAMYQNFSQQQMRMKQQGGGIPSPFVPANGPMRTGSVPTPNNNLMDPQLIQQQQFLIQQQQRNPNFMMNYSQASPSFMAQQQVQMQQTQQVNGPMSVSSPSITSSVDFMAPNSNSGLSTVNSNGPGPVLQQNNFQQTVVSNGTPNFVSSPVGNGMSPMKSNNNTVPFSPLSNGLNQHQLLEQQQRANFVNGQTKRSFLFTSEMANAAAHEVNNLKRYDNMVSWHMAMTCNQYASTSTALNINNAQNHIVNGRSPLDGFSMNGNSLSPSTSQPNSAASTSVTTTSGRGSKRKASQQVNSTPSPRLTQPHSSLSSNDIGSNFPNSIDPLSNTVSSSFGPGSLNESNAVLNSAGTPGSDFLRPPSAANSIKSACGNDIFNTSGNKLLGDDHDNPLKKIELMTNQCLNDPSPKMSRLVNDMSNGIISAKLVDQKSKEQKLAKLDNIEQKLISSGLGSALSGNASGIPPHLMQGGMPHPMFMGPGNGGPMNMPQHLLMGANQGNGPMPGTPGFNQSAPHSANMDPQMFAMLRQQQLQQGMFNSGASGPQPGMAGNVGMMPFNGNANEVMPNVPPQFMMNGSNGAGPMNQEIAGGPGMMNNNNNFMPGTIPSNQQMLMMMNGRGGERQPMASPSFNGAAGENVNAQTPPVNGMLATHQQQQRLFMQQQAQMQFMQQQQQNSPRFGPIPGMPQNANASAPVGAMNNGQIEAFNQQQQLRMLGQPGASFNPGMMMPMDVAAMQQNGMIRNNGQGGEFSGMWPQQHQMPQPLANLDARVPVQKMQYFGPGGAAQKPNVPGAMPS